MIKLLDEKSRSWKGLNMVTENEMKEKLKKLQEAKSLQEEKTKAAPTTVNPRQSDASTPQSDTITLHLFHPRLITDIR